MSSFSKQLYEWTECVIKRVLISLCMGFWATSVSFAQEPITIDLGPKKDVTQLYSFPNNCGAVVCYLDQTLEQTIEEYLRASLKRDGYEATTVKVTIFIDEVSDPDQRVSVQLNGEGADAYANLLPKYMEAGKRGIEGVGKIKHFTPDPDALVPDDCSLYGDSDLNLKVPEGWRYSWRFFMPHGVAMTNHYTVELLHFPPSDVLMEKQDYLAASTTKRWAKLLVENGAMQDEVDRFQNIIDIVPIAAPHADGCKLKSTLGTHSYSQFNDYNIELLELWLLQAGPAASRPMVAFGSPARKWLKAALGVNLKVLKLATVPLPSGLKVPTLGANHPSYIWAAKKHRCHDNPDTGTNEALGCIMKVMQKDLVAACWQVRMGKDPTANPKDTLVACHQAWSKRDRRLCELSYSQVWNRSEDEAEQLCSDV